MVNIYWSFQNSCDALYVYLSFIFSSTLVDAALPDNFTNGNVILIPKSKNTILTDSNNYVGVASSSLFGKTEV